MKQNVVPSTSFAGAVLRVVRGIRRGRVMTYGSVARCAGFPRAARAVGTLMKKNRDPRIPCHRVICADGRVGQYNRGSAKKIAMLRSEGVIVRSGRVDRGQIDDSCQKRSELS